MPNNLDKYYVVLIDGEKATTLEDFLNQMYEKLNFPYKKYANYNAYLDWMRDLSWLKEKEVAIVILNFEYLLKYLMFFHNLLQKLYNHFQHQ